MLHINNKKTEIHPNISLLGVDFTFNAILVNV